MKKSSPTRPHFIFAFASCEQPPDTNMASNQQQHSAGISSSTPSTRGSSSSSTSRLGERQEGSPTRTTCFVRSEDIQTLRGRFEQLEHEMTLAAKSNNGDCDDHCHVWKDFRRVYGELEILQEEILRKDKGESPSTATVECCTLTVDAKDLISLLERSHPQLLNLWNETRLCERSDDGKGSEDVETVEETSRSESTVEHATVTRGRFWAFEDNGSPPLRSSPQPNNSNNLMTPASQSQIVTLQAWETTNAVSTFINFAWSTPFLEDLSGNTSNETMSDIDRDARQRRIQFRLDQCEATKFPFKKKLRLERLGIISSDFPIRSVVGKALGNSLHKLSMMGNPLSTIPNALVQNLPNLRSLDLSECELNSLPQTWHLPLLKKLNLSYNRLRDFPDQAVCEGLPELVELNLYGNKISSMRIPMNSAIFTKLEILNVGYNDLPSLPPELDQLKSLRTLKVTNNFIEQVPQRVCEMNLRMIDVSFNPVTQPPMETCERGLCSMRRYYHVLQMETQAVGRVMTDRRRASTAANHRRTLQSFYGALYRPSV